MDKRFVSLLVFFLALDTLAIFLFTTGFFLTRAELELSSSCDSVPRLDNLNSNNTARKHCWLNALKYEFAQWREDLDLPQERPFDNKLPIIRDLLKYRPLHSFLVPFYADPPTTTLQRLKGLTTGGLPTFLEFKDDFDSHGMEITEDNILDLFIRSNKQMVFMGDDTWTALYPTQFKRSFPFPSFNVKDLHTVDNGVIKHLESEILRDDWDVIIAHFLGVDHVGHRYGPYHPAMKEKLLQMNLVLEGLVNLMNQRNMNDTILFVFGDHGMTDDGNHGGSSDEEVGAALFVYSPSVLYGHVQKEGIHRNVSKLNNVTELLYTASELETSRRNASHPIIQQIDLAPTLALLLGLPIPFSSLGMIMPELFFQESDQNDLVEQMRNLNEAFEVNLAQVVRYLLSYENHTTSKINRKSLERILKKAQISFQKITDLEKTASSHERKLEAHKEFYRIARASLKEASELGRALWTTFDLYRMLLALFVLMLSISFKCRELLKEMQFSSDSFNSVSFLTCVLLLLQLAALFTNSYIVAEASVMRFSSVTFSFALLMKSLSASTPSRGSIYCGKDSSLQAHASERAFEALTLALCARVAPSLAHEQWRRSQEVLPADHLHLWIWIHGFLPLLGISKISQTFFLRKRKRLHMYIILLQLGLVGIYWITQSIIKIDDSPYKIPHMYCARAVFLISLMSMIFTGKSSMSNGIEYIVFLVPTFLLLIGPASSLVFLMIMAESFCISRLNVILDIDLISRAFAWMNLLSLYFYATGHECDIPKLHIGSAYVGFEEFNKIRSGFFLGLNTCAIHVVFTLALPILTKPRKDKSLNQLKALILAFQTIQAMRTFATSSFVTLERRHLMVWAIFAPKYAFEGAMLLLVDSLCLLAWLKSGQE